MQILNQIDRSSFGECPPLAAYRGRAFRRWQQAEVGTLSGGQVGMPASSGDQLETSCRSADQRRRGNALPQYAGTVGYSGRPGAGQMTLKMPTVRNTTPRATSIQK